MLLAVSAVGLRRPTYLGWLGSGWPEWVAEDGDPEQYNENVNHWNSIASFCQLFVCLLPGLWLDFCHG